MSEPRLSRRITRMQQRGLITRQECPVDGRGSIVGERPSLDKSSRKK